MEERTRRWKPMEMPAEYLELCDVVFAHSMSPWLSFEGLRIFVRVGTGFIGLVPLASLLDPERLFGNYRFIAPIEQLKQPLVILLCDMIVFSNAKSILSDIDPQFK